MTYEIKNCDGYASLKLCGEMDGSGANTLDTECLEQLLKDGLKNTVLLCEDLQEISILGIRSLLSIQRKLRASQKKLILVGLKDSLAQFLVMQGVNNSLPIHSSLRSALVDFGLMTHRSLDVNFINPFLTATMNVLKIQASTECRPGQMIKRENKDRFLGDITGIIGLISEAFSGSVIISFPESTFLKIVSRMLGEDFSCMSKDLEDAAGELTNIIFGQAKIVLNEAGYGIKTAIPSVVTGKDHSVQNISTGPRMSIAFATDVGEFFVEICVSN